jgi:hypothetical protein
MDFFQTEQIGFEGFSLIGFEFATKRGLLKTLLQKNNNLPHASKQQGCFFNAIQWKMS